jgi:hypothetical protein
MTANCVSIKSFGSLTDLATRLILSEFLSENPQREEEKKSQQERSQYIILSPMLAYLVLEAC